MKLHQESTNGVTLVTRRTIFHPTPGSPIYMMMQGSTVRVEVHKSTGDHIVYRKVED
jgi:hypothetical protein